MGVTVIYLDQLLPVGSAIRQATYPLVMLGPSTSLLGLAGGGVYPASAVTGTAVRSYRTISPLPVPSPVALRLTPELPNRCRPSAVYFLRHFPWGCPRWLLAITVPCPARTFLPRCFAFAKQNGGGDRPTHSFN